MGWQMPTVETLGHMTCGKNHPCSPHSHTQLTALEATLAALS